MGRFPRKNKVYSKHHASSADSFEVRVYDNYYSVYYKSGKIPVDKPVLIRKALLELKSKDVDLISVAKLISDTEIKRFEFEITDQPFW